MFYLGRAHDEVTPCFSALEQHLRVDKTDQPVPAQHIVLFASCHRLHVFFLVFTLNLRSPEHCYKREVPFSIFFLHTPVRNRFKASSLL